MPSAASVGETLVTTLKPHRNWYLDLSNERNILDARVTSMADLAELLRISLDNNHAEFVTLAEELEFSKLYVSVMSRRFPDHLAVDWQIDPEVLNAAVPNMILQPLIENAIKHGVGVENVGRCVTIRAENTGLGRVRFAIINPVGGCPADAPRSGHGIGLTHTRQRLQHHYGNEYEFGFHSYS